MLHPILGSLWLILGLATPSADLVTLPIQFFLKDRYWGCGGGLVRIPHRSAVRKGCR